MFLRAFLPVVAVAVFFGLLAAMPGAGAAEPYFQGPKVCLECHKAEYAVWEGTKHFKSFRTAHKAKNAKKITAAVGGKKSMKKNAVCTVCHYTNVSKKEGAKAKPKAGPSCESCHGASSDWITIHNNYGGPNMTAADESADHKAERRKMAVEANMTWSFMRYDIAKNCMSCHGLTRDEIDGDTLAKMLDAGHPLKAEFELVRYSQGTVRHSFYPPDVTVNAQLSAAALAEAFIQGQAAKLVSASGAIGKSDNAKYKAAQEQRIADASAALSALAGVPEAQALVADPSETNARALIDAIAGTDQSGAVAGLLPDPTTYK